MTNLVRRTYRQARQKISTAARPQDPDIPVSLAGETFRMPSSRRCPLDLSPQHENWLDAVFNMTLQHKPGCFVDVGVNRGQTLAKFLSISPKRQYVGFEPQPYCVYFLQEFLRINDLTNCMVLPFGLADQTSLYNFYMKDEALADSTASISESHRPSHFYTNSRSIPVFKGDDAVDQLDIEHISVIKIDVEGAELEVILGLHQTIKALQPFLVFEVLNNFLVATGEQLPETLVQHRNRRAANISSTLESLGYVIYNIRNNKLIRASPIKPEVSSDLAITDYLAVPKMFDHQIREDFLDVFDFVDTARSQDECPL